MTSRPAPFPHGFPLRENCDPDDPHQAYLWALVALPGQNGGPLLMPVEYLQLVSKRLTDCFGLPRCAACGHVEEPRIKYRRPTSSDPHWMTSPGHWVDADAPDTPDRRPARRAVDSITPTQRAELFRELYRDHTPRERYELMRQAVVDGQDQP